jgi:hypothetical protein
MMLVRRLVAMGAAVVMAAGLGTMTAPAARAGDVASSPNLSGRWDSAAVKMGDVGWTMRLRPVADKPNVYVATFTSRKDGTATVTEGPMRLVVRGERVRLVWRGVPDEAPAPGQRTVVRGTIGQDGSIFLPRCYTVLTLVVKATADEGCLFQERPSS